MLVPLSSTSTVIGGVVVEATVVATVVVSTSGTSILSHELQLMSIGFQQEH